MGSTGALQAGSYGVQGLSSIGGAIAQSQALRAQGAYRQSVYNTNAGLARMQGAQALSQGDISASRLTTQARGIQGAQRAAFAAQGVDTGSGSAGDVTASTGALGALDALTIKNNAWRQSFGYNVQAIQASSQGQFAKMAADNQAGNTLLTGGMRAVGFGMQGYGAWLASKKGVTPDDLEEENETGWMENH